MTFPPPARADVDWAKLSPLVNDDLPAGHIECQYSAATQKWTTPKLVQDPHLRIHGLAPGLNYGMQAYEGLKAFRSPTDQILLFRPQRHAKRMVSSTVVVSIPDIPEELFLRCVRLAVSMNASIVPPAATGGCLYIRPVAFGSAPQLALVPPSEFTFCVYVHPAGAYHGVDPVDAIVLDAFDRAAPRGTGRAKVGGNYAPTIRHSDQARKQGYPLTLHLDAASRTLVDEFSTSAFLGLKRQKDGTVALIYPDNDTVIDSVTADSAAHLATALGWEVCQRKVPFAELDSFDEIVAAGTAAALVPVRSITRRLDNGKEQKWTSRGTQLATLLREELCGVQKGTKTDAYGWCDEIKPARHYVKGGVETVFAPKTSIALDAPMPAGKALNWLQSSPVSSVLAAAGAVLLALTLGGWSRHHWIA